MHTPDWISDAIFYQIFPDRFRNGDTSNDPPGVEPWGGRPTRENRFGGDLAGIIDKLDYIAGMGFNAIYLNPIFTAGSNHKYDTHDYFTIDPAFGDDVTFDRLLSEAHARGVRIVLDGVFNHCGLDFERFGDVLARGQASSYRDWFNLYGFPVKPLPTPNYATCGGAHYLPRLNTRNPEVEAFIHRVALHWLERGIDGWRLDVPYEVETDFWRRFRRVVKAGYPNAYLVAEEWRDPSAFLRGDTFDGATHYLLRGLAFDFIVKNALTGEAFGRALEMLRGQLPEGSEYGMLTLLGGHDTTRVLTECGGDLDSAILLYTFLMCMPGAPMIYYGDENGMEGENDPDCRRPMIWEASRWRLPLRGATTRLLELRRKHEVLRRGAFEPILANDRVFAFQRELADDKALVVLNNSGVARTLSIPVTLPDGTVLADMLRQAGDSIEPHGFEVRQGRIEVPSARPKSALVLMHCS
ncbi:MAG: glycoside hydrolase family 13 protein [Trueperaceae bacterium]